MGEGRFMVAVGAIIEANDGEILLLKRGPGFMEGYWEIGTGRLHQGESPEEGLKREIKEETGLIVDVKKILRTFHFYRGDVNPVNEVIGIMYWCKANSKNIKLSSEHTDFLWLPPHEAQKKVDFDGFRADINIYLSVRNSL
jgi:8-oxo-dGTP pyrophosphatase MutT (NUDIX family)